MTNTLGYHYVKSTYGQWLPGDERGHWSAIWDERIGFIEPHRLHPGDPVRKRMAEERMRHPPVWLSEPMKMAIERALGYCVRSSHGGRAVVAATLECTHLHLLIPYNGRDIKRTTKWIADQTTKAVHLETEHQGPVWCKGKWCTYVFESSHWKNAREYIERHNLRRGKPRRPFDFLS